MSNRNRFLKAVRPAIGKKRFFLGFAAISVAAVLLLAGCKQPVDPVYTVTFDMNGGDTEASPQTMTVTGQASTLEALPEQPTRTGYFFVEWNTQADGTGTAFTTSTPVTEDITVYARWQEDDPGNTGHTPAYGISLNPSGPYTFPVAAPGYGAQTAKSVLITNTRNQATGALILELSGAGSASFTLLTTAISNIAAGGNDTFTVVPKTGLPLGTYTATVTVSGGNGIVANFNVSFTVNVSAPGLGSLGIGIGFNFGAITITGSDGTNIIHKTGTPTSLTLSATGYTGVQWYVDGVLKSGATGSSITLTAAAYDIRNHSVTFTGIKDGIPYSQLIPFRVVQ